MITVTAEFRINEGKEAEALAAIEKLVAGVSENEPGARTYLHTHAVPQVLHCVEGRGILATKSEQNLVEAGDIVHVPAGEEHWHGAAADSHFVHLSVRPPGESTWTRVDPLG